MRPIPAWLLLIAALTALGPVSIDMYLPALPEIARELAARGVENTMAAYFLGLLFGQLFYGPISDRFGRKPPLYVGLILYGAGSLGCALSTSMEMLVITRALQAAGGCAGLVIGRAIVRDRHEPHEAARALSTLLLIVALGPILAPVIGGWIVTGFGWRAIFFFQAALAVTLLAAMHFVLTESRFAEPGATLRIANVLKAYGRLLKNLGFLGYSLSIGFTMGTLLCYVTGAPAVFSKTYGLSPQQFGWVIGLNGLAFMSANHANIVALRTRGLREVLRGVVGIPILFSLALLGVAVFFKPPIALVLILQVGLFFSHARINPNVVALALSEQGHQAGTASALLGSLQSGISAIAGAAVATFGNGSLERLAFMMALGSAFAWLMYAWAARADAQSDK